MVAPAIQLFSDDRHIGLVGVRFPVELRAEGFELEEPSTWPKVEERLEFVGGRLLYIPPCADYQQDVAMDVAFVLRSWSEAHPEFIVGGNEAGMKLGRDVRAADVAVWRASAATPRSGRVRRCRPSSRWRCRAWTKRNRFCATRRAGTSHMACLLSG